MRLLLDESVPRQLALELPGHEVSNVQAEGWAGTTNGRLIELAAAAGFMALISCDQGMEHQQSPLNLPISVVILKAPTNTLEDLAPLMSLVVLAIQSSTEPRFVTVGQ